MDKDLRRSPRYPFFASAEITDEKTKSLMKARTSELCLHGCYMDMMNPLLLGSSLRVRIVHQGAAVDASARVVHAQPNVGMGLAFDGMEDSQQQVLQSWLGELQAL